MFCRRLPKEAASMIIICMHRHNTSGILIFVRLLQPVSTNTVLAIACGFLVLILLCCYNNKTLIKMLIYTTKIDAKVVSTNKQVPFKLIPRGLFIFKWCACTDAEGFIRGRQHIACYTEPVLAIVDILVRLSVRPSVRHTLAPYQNDAS